ncbi:MotE family protein [Pseudalkalibacillus caeni]|uniref:Magnesium transporter MgtE intracellular domain-containing protein n=1 Tax=Exobacillus caeni TaxID=2574798 RepID=A0A5R9F7Z3_9BACL|nr:hypothetical protein [Pseudalkalibacillus caeni]TLS36634.1 hypothetical protein FCL54_14020 [Pseudalkalibacillus caeni]
MRKKERTSFREIAVHYFLIPVFFTLLLSGIILSFIGYDVKAISENVPFISGVFSADETKAESEESENNRARLNEQERQLRLNEQKLDEKDRMISGLKEENEKLKKSLEEKRQTEEERFQKLKELAELYADMTPTKSAAIVENLTLTEAAMIIDQMESNQKSAILSRVNPAFAANVTVAMKELEKAENPEIDALQQRIDVYMKSLVPEEQNLSVAKLAKTIDKIPDDQAASILEAMAQSETEKELAMKVLNELGESKQNTLLSEIDEKVAEQLKDGLK